MKITYNKASQKTLRRMPANRSRTIRAKIESYATDPASQSNNVTTLQGRPVLRLRVGDDRVLFAVQDSTMMILDIGPRGGIYG